MVSVPREENRIPGLVAVSNADNTTPVVVLADPVTGRLLVNSTGGTGTNNQTVNISAGTVSIGTALPTGTNAIGTVAVSSIQGALPTGNNRIGTVQVSVLPSLPSGGNTIGSVTILGTLSTTPPANQTVNLIQINGVAASVNAGTSDAGTLRTTLGDGSNTVGSVNILLNGGTVSVNTGNVDAQTLRVTVASNSLGQIKLVNGANISATMGTVSINTRRGSRQSTYTAVNNTTATTSVIGATANTFNDVYGCIVANKAATANRVSFLDGTGNQTVFVIEVPSTDTRGLMLPFHSAINQTGSNAIWQAQCDVSGSIEITMLYYQASQ